jgi:RNA polymerase sigma-70 factor (ECF subfamily)
MTAGRAEQPGPQNEPHRDLESLIRATHAELGRIAYRILGNKADADDAIQNACIKMLRCWPKVAGFATAAQQRAYLIRTVTNEALQIRRQPLRERELLAQDLLSAEQTDRGWMPDFPGGSGQEAKEQLRRVWKAISELPEENRDVMALHAGGYEYREIAEMLDIAVSTVGSHVSSARKRLRLAMGDDWEEGQA